MGENNSMEISSNISWTARLEEYFASTGEKANGLAWVHKKAEAMYSNRRTYIDLPVIIGSGLIAFLNAGSSTLFEDPKISSIALGVGSLFMGILNSFGSYFGWAKRAEGHRISAIHYAKLYRFITVELSLPRAERMTPNALLKYVKDQYDRLAEISPMVPDIIIGNFQSRFKHEKISKPEEANGLHKIDIYRDVDDDDSMREMPLMTKSPTPSIIRKVPSFEDMMSPKELPKMALRIPEPRKSTTVIESITKPESRKNSDTVVTSSDVVIDIPESEVKKDI